VLAHSEYSITSPTYNFLNASPEKWDQPIPDSACIFDVALQISFQESFFNQIRTASNRIGTIASKAAA
jgi:hypothetical protein